MIGLNQVVISVSMGLALLVLGLVPGLFHEFAEGVRNALATFQNGSLMSPRFRVYHGRQAQIVQPRWLAAIGAALIAGTLLAYYSH